MTRHCSGYTLGRLARTLAARPSCCETRRWEALCFPLRRARSRHDSLRLLSRSSHAAVVASRGAVCVNKYLLQYFGHGMTNINEITVTIFLNSINWVSALLPHMFSYVPCTGHASTGSGFGPQFRLDPPWILGKATAPVRWRPAWSGAFGLYIRWFKHLIALRERRRPTGASSVRRLSDRPAVRRCSVRCVAPTSNRRV